MPELPQTMEALDITSFVIGIVALCVSVWAVFDVRDQFHKALELQRNLAYTEALNDLIFDFVQPSTPGLQWTPLHKLVIIGSALNPEQDGDAFDTAARYGALWLADQMVKSGRAVWKQDFDPNKVGAELKKWSNAKNEARMKLILDKVYPWIIKP